MVFDGVASGGSPWRPEVVPAIDFPKLPSPPLHRPRACRRARFSLGLQGPIFDVASVTHVVRQLSTCTTARRSRNPHDRFPLRLFDPSGDPLQMFLRPRVVRKTDKAVTDLGDAEFFQSERAPDPKSTSRPQPSAAGLTTDRPGDVITRRDWVLVWSTVAANSFGGPAGQIAVMHDEIVVKRKWIGERRFLHALNYCMLLPGPEAQQLATYLGWLLRGPAGGLFAGSIFILPGFLSIMALSVLFAAYGDVVWVSGLFFGISAAVIAGVVNAFGRIGRRVIKNPTMLAIAACAFVAIFVFELPFPLIVIFAAAIGLIGGRRRPDTFNLIQGGTSSNGGSLSQDAADGDEEVLVGDEDVSVGRPSWGRALRVLTIGLALWFVPVLALALFLGRASVFVDVALFFSGAAVLTFGGAYSVLAYISQEAVNSFGWLEPDEMISGLGMAETTPGPLIQVVQFVGFMGPYRSPGSLPAWQAGISGAVIATWVTFVPSFLWIFLGAPFIEHLRNKPALTSALSTVTAAVVGAVLNLALWFAVFTLFDSVDERRGFGAVIYQPDLTSIDPAALAIAAGAAFAIFNRKIPTLKVIAAAALAGVIYELLFV